MKRIIVVGGGAGGLELATYLGNQLGKKKKAQIILVDRNQTHLWKPLLHEVATGTLDPGADAVTYRVHAHQHGFEYQQGLLTGLNRSAKTITLAPIQGEEGELLVAERELQYDYLVIAIGSKSNDFNTKGVSEHCIFLDNSEQAIYFQHKMLELFLKYSQNQALGETKAQHLMEKGKVNIAIVGGGATGVELSAELYNAAKYLSSYGFGKLDKERLQVTLIEAGDRILPALPDRIATSACSELKKLGVVVKTQTKIVEVIENHLITADDQVIAADLMVWAAGVKVSEMTQQLDGLERNKLNQLTIKPTLQTTQDDAIFVIGDCASLMQEGKPIPPRAQAAHQMAKTCGKNIVALLNQKPLTAFRYNDKGSLVSLSRFTAVGNLMGNLTKGSMKVEGSIARLMYISLYRLHQFALHGCLKTGLIILIGRINRILKPSMKLH